jgi:hypothetical protein
MGVARIFGARKLAQKLVFQPFIAMIKEHHKLHRRE